MTHILLRNLVWSGPAAVAFLVLLPLLAGSVDQSCGLVWPFPPWASVLAVVPIAAGAVLALWSIYLFARVGEGTPNPIAPPQRLVSQGPYRHSRNPMMLGGWILGLGLALALRSVSLLVGLGLIVAAGCIYVRLIEEPRLRKRFGTTYEDYARMVPRWLRLCLIPLCACVVSVQAGLGFAFLSI